MPDGSLIAIGISSVSLCVSLVVMWITFFHRGEIKMTQPTTVMVGPDGPDHSGESKIYIRTLMYSTSKRGGIVEGMFVRLSSGEHRQNFPVWVLGEGGLARGSGIFVGEQGVASNHHFLLPPGSRPYDFVAGEYFLEVFVQVVGRRGVKCIWAQKLVISDSQAAALSSKGKALFFDWGPDSMKYISHIRSKPQIFPPVDFENLAVERATDDVNGAERGKL